MSVYVMADLHLATACREKKSMEVFGSRWKDYENKIKKNWTKIINEDDTVIIPGDISWATSLDECVSDFSFINSLPGKKIFGKGNHDYWWSTISKMKRFNEENRFDTISFLYNEATIVEDFIITGTRGWFPDMENPKIPENSDYDKLINRESARLKLGLEEAKKLRESNPDKEILVFLHFPPIWKDCAIKQFTSIIESYGIKRCYFGHIHASYNAEPFFEYNGVEYILISADFINFVPRLIYPQSP